MPPHILPPLIIMNTWMHPAGCPNMQLNSHVLCGPLITVSPEAIKLRLIYKRKAWVNMLKNDPPQSFSDILHWRILEAVDKLFFLVTSPIHVIFLPLQYS